MKHALFEGLVVSEEGEAVGVAYVGDEPQYVIPDAGFQRHVDAERVDRQVFALLQQQVMAHRDMVTESALAMLGQDDLFTKAMIDASIQNMEQVVDELIQQGLPEETKHWLGMLGFRVVVNLHGDVVRVEGPGQDSIEFE